LPQAQLIEKGLEKLSIFCQGYAFRPCAEYGHSGLSQGRGEIKGGLPSKLQNNPHGPFGLHNIQYILFCERLKIELVRGVIVGADRFGVTVDHNTFNTLFPQGKGCLHTAIVKLNTLADPVRPSTQDHNLFSIGHPDLVLLFIGGVVVRCSGLKLGCTRVNQFIDWSDSGLASVILDFLLIHFKEVGQLNIGEAKGFALPDKFWGQRRTSCYNLLLKLHNLFYLVQEPGVDLGKTTNITCTHPGPYGMPDIKQALGIRVSELLPDLLR